MRKNIQILMFMIAFGVIFGGAVSSYGQIKTGGYRAVDVTTAGVVQAAEFAVQSRSETEEMTMSVESIKKAEQQVVAGINYRLCIEVYYPSEEAETDGVLQFVQAIIYKDLKGNFKLTSWQEAECAPEEEMD